ncbi:DUF4192 domain-containing protein [Kitasatospora paranensis]|uniref:DUF4192 domain-containing protein n=1 Tax=Kitasatospora paranensis TaxID=258053 RepID=UPI0031EFD0F6
MNNDERSPQPATPSSRSLTGTLPMQMRGPADMAEMLPYLLGFFPDDSIVAVGLQGPSLHQGGVIRIDIPADPEQWPQVARDAAGLLIELSEKRDRRPSQVLLYLVRESSDTACGPPPGGGPPPSTLPPSVPAVPEGVGPPDVAPAVTELRPLADALAAAFEAAGVGVKESLCVSRGRWWSFLCRRPGCCDPAGTPVRPAHLPSPIAAAATYAGLAPRGSRKAMVAGLAPVGPPTADVQRQEIERAGPHFIQELAAGRMSTVDRTGRLLTEAMAALAAGARELDPVLTARILLGLQDKLGRDRGAELAEPDELARAQRLWRHLVQRCVSPFEHLAPPPLTLLAWTSWLAGDTATARIVLSRALEVDPGYTLAQLLYESINGGLPPERLLESVRGQRARRAASAPPGGPFAAVGSSVDGDAEATGPGSSPGPATGADAGAPADGGADPGTATGTGTGNPTASTSGRAPGSGAPAATGAPARPEPWRPAPPAPRPAGRSARARPRPRGGPTARRARGSAGPGHPVHG